MKRFSLFVMLCLLCILQSSAQVELLFDTDNTKYYESMNAATPPADNWYAEDFDDSSWSDYTGKMDYPEYDAFWVRSKIVITDDPANYTFNLKLAHDDEGYFYVNGHEVWDATFAVSRYSYAQVPSSYLKKGINVIAVYTKDTGGDSYLEYDFYADKDGIVYSLPKSTELGLSNSKINLINYDNSSVNQKQLTSCVLTSAGATDAEITWSTSDASVATVENGLVKAVSVGTATITATATVDDVVYSKECAVTVEGFDSDSKVVYVETPGTLSSLLTDDEKENTEKLTVIGTLNGNDVQVLRFMGGRTSSSAVSPGALEDLNLKKANFVNDGTTYSSSDGTYYTNEGQLLNNMFYKCDRLVKVTLPESCLQVGASAFRECKNLEQVVINESLNILGSATFLGCPNLDNVVIPASVSSIESDCFFNCSALKTVTFEENSRLTQIGSNAFYGTALTSITIPASVTYLDRQSFENIGTLKEVKFAEGSQLTTLNEYAFCGDRALTSVSLPSSLETIGEYTFSGCYALTSVDIPEDSKISSIGEYAFNGAILSSFFIPKDLVSIENIGLNGSTLKSITVHPENKFFETSSNVIYNKKEKNIAFIPTTVSGVLSLPSYLTRIADNQFDGCSGLSGIVLPAVLKSIGSNAFNGCTGIKTLISLNTTPPTLSDNALSALSTSNVNVIVPEEALAAYQAADQWSAFTSLNGVGDAPITYINASQATLYNYDSSLFNQKALDVTFVTKTGVYDGDIQWTSSNPEVATVDANGLVKYAGIGTTNITATATINDSIVTAVCQITCPATDGGKFVVVETPGTLSTLLTEDEKDDLTKLTIIGNINSDDLRVLRYMAGRDEYSNLTVGLLEDLDLSNATIVYGGEGYRNDGGSWQICDGNEIGSYLFYQCGSLKKITLPQNLTRISYQAFYGCENLETVVIPESVTSISSDVFEYCSKLSNISLPSGLTEIGSSVFRGCTNLKTIDLSHLTNLTYIVTGTFYESGLTSITIPACVTQIGDNAFDGTNLESITFSEDSKLNTIGNEAFRRCSKLTSIDIPASVITLDRSVFTGCSKLETINFSEDAKLTTIGEGVLFGTAIKSLFIPRRVMSIAQMSFLETLDSISVDPRNKAFEVYDGSLVCMTEKSLKYVPSRIVNLQMPDYVTTLDNYVLRNHTNLESVTLSPNMSNLNDGPFSGCNNLKTIVCLDTISPAVINLSINLQNDITVYVPVGAKENYLSSGYGWDDSRFTLCEATFEDGIDLDVHNETLYAARGGKELQLTPTVTTSRGPISNSSLTWQSTNADVATVDDNGLVTYAGEGSALIIATAAVNGVEYSDTCSITAFNIENAENTVILKNGGELSSLFSDDEKYNVTSLIVRGKVSGDDISMLRDMAGVDSGGNATEGKLADLDLKDATFVSNGKNVKLAGFIIYPQDGVLCEYAFNGCTALKNVVLPDTMSVIKRHAFAGCSNLKSVTLPSKLQNVEAYAFNACTNLSSVTFPSALQMIDEWAFAGCDSMTTVILPEGFQTIGYGSFNNCDSLSSVQLPNSLLSIGDYAFANSKSLKSITIPSNITTLSSHAFAYCPSLSSVVYFADEPLSIDEVFYGSNDSYLIVKEGKSEAYKNSSWNVFANILEIGDQPRILLNAEADTLYAVDNADYNRMSLTALVVTKEGVLTIPVTWTSSNDSIVTVSADGVVSYAGEGSAVVTASVSVDGETVSSQCSFNTIGAGNGGKMVVVETAGTLSTLLTEDEQDDLKSLVVLGNINSDDLRVLRYMAGRDEYGNLTAGLLEDLDLSNATIVAGGQGFKNEGSYWRTCSNNSTGDYLFYKCNSLKKITLPRNLTRINEYVFDTCEKLETVVIPESVTTIGYCAFSQCKMLSNINLPSGLTTIYGRAFYSCSNLKSLDLSHLTSLTNIVSYCFNGSGLTSITIPASVTQIGSSAFESSKLEKVEFADGCSLNQINSSVFANCSNLKNFDLPDNILSISDYAFGNSGLEAINISEDSKLSIISSNAFNGSNIKSFYVPRKLMDLSEAEFPSTLEEFIVNPLNKTYTAINGDLYTKEDTVLCKVPKAKTIFKCADGLKSIPANAFSGCTNLTTVIISASIDSINSNAFSDCTSLKVISSLNPNVPVTVDETFNNVSKESTLLFVPTGSLASYKADANWADFNMDEIGDEPKIILDTETASLYDVDNASYNQKSLTALVVTKDGISTLPVTWTSSDESIVTVSSDGVVSYVGEGSAVVTASVTVDGETSSSQCTFNTVSVGSDGKMVAVETAGTLSSLLTEDEKDNLKTLIVMGNINSDDLRVLRYMAGRDEYGNLTAGLLEDLDLSNATIVAGGEGYQYEGSWWRTCGDNSTGDYVFYKCNSLKKITLPQNLTRIDEYVFDTCEKLETVVIPESVTTIGYCAFSQCKMLSNINLPSGLTTLYGRAFYSCSNLKSLDLSHLTSLTNIVENCFNGSGLTSITIPASVTQIGSSAFRSSNLERVEFADGCSLNQINSSVFANCSNLKTIDLPDNVVSISDNAFGNSGLETINISEDSKLSSIKSNSFNGTSIKSFYVPRKLMDLSEANFPSTLESFAVNPLNKVYTEFDGCIYTKEDTALCKVPYAITTFKCADGLKYIPANAFSGCYKLTTVVLSASIDSINSNAFSDCSSLKTIYSLNPNVPATVNETFNNVSKGATFVYVPTGSLASYKADDNWADFNMIETDYDYCINLSSPSIKVYNANGGNTKTLEALVFTPEGPAECEVSWTSADSNIAKVDENGVVTYAGEGSTTITASANVGGKDVTAECAVTSVNFGEGKNVWYVETAGTLSTLIPDSLKYTISDLTLFGNINADDVCFIRDMAGKDNGNCRTEGKLAHLNIQGVNVVSGGSYYSTYYGTYDNSSNYLNTGAFSALPVLEDVVLPETMTTISNGLFRGCSKLSSVTLPTSLQTISGEAFYECPALASIYIPSGVTSIGGNAFGYCSALKSILTLGKYPSTLDGNAFNGLSKNNISIIVSEGSLEAYRNSTWSDFININEVTNLPIIILGNDNISLYSFKSAGASSRTIPATVITETGVIDAPISWKSSDTGIVTVSNDGQVSMTGTSGSATVTASTTIDGKSISATCTVKTNVVDAENAYYVEAGNLPNLISDEEKSTIKNLVLYGELNGTDIKFIREMAGIPEYYFYSSTDGTLETLDMSNARIVSGGSSYGGEEYVYNENGDWSNMWMNTEDDVIGNGMFRGSNSLKTIVLPMNIKKIGSYAFYESNNLNTTFELPSTVTTLEPRALYGFDKVVAQSDAPATLSSTELITEDAIVVVHADALTTYKAADKWTEFKSQIIAENESTTADVAVTAESNGSGLLSALGEDRLAYTQELVLTGTINSYDIMIMRNRMPMLHNIDLSGVDVVANAYEYYTGSHSEDHRLGANAFRELTKLRTVILPKTITYVGNSAFYECSNLRSVKTYDKLVTIDDNAFYNCSALNNVELADGLESIGTNAFHNCDRLDSLYVPNSVLSIQSGAFSDCNSLKYIHLSDNLSNIQYYTFAYCNSLKSIAIPAKVRSIDYYAFHSCSSLTELRIPPMVESIGDQAFNGCDNIKDVYVYIANAKDIAIDMNTFSCWTKATLHIPSFSYNTYYWDTQWGQFYDKVEFSETYDEFYTKNTLSLNNETGTISGNPDATVYEEGGLVVDDVEQNLSDVTVVSDGDKGASLIASSDGTINIEKLTININVTANQWHFFCFPYNIPLDSVKYDGDYVWRQYDGAARSRKEGGWQDLAEDATELTAGKGYIFQGTNTGVLSMVIPNPDLSAADVSTSIFTYESESTQDESWNFVGNPYISYYSIDETTYSSPITVWTGSGYEAYRPGDDDYEFYPYQAFFVQTPAETTEISFTADARETYDSAQETVSTAKARRARAKINTSRKLINLEITAENDSVYTDKTRIVFNDKTSMDYEISCDAAKFFSSTRPIEIFTVDNKGTQYAINERPVDNGSVDLAISVNKTGNYSIECVRMDIPVILVDHVMNETHDLNVSPYLFSAEKGTASKRFTIRIADSEMTDIDAVSVEPGDLDIELNNCDNLFDISGRKVKNTAKNKVYISKGRKVLAK